MKRPFRLSTSQVILLAFLLADLIGAFLLCLPISSADGNFTPFVDALFTSTTSVCVTGLTVVNTAAHWSLFGKMVILALIQIGGLGIISITTAVLLIFRRKTSLSDRVLLEDALNLNTMSGLIPFLQRVISLTFSVELIGMLLCLPVFVPLYGAEGVWYALFHAVSAFCNAGIDILGPDSLVPFVSNIWLNIVTMLLIVIGGIGALVWWDMIGTARRLREKKIAGRHFFSSLTVHSRIVLCVTVTLIFFGAFLFFIFEYDNPETLGALPLGEKITAAFFQSVTLRTAGFISVPQASLTSASVLISMILMFIGGSPIGTAGGIKTTTFIVLVLSIAATVRGKREPTVMRRTIGGETVRKAMAVTGIFFCFALFALILLFSFTGGDPTDICFEVFSALGTVGVTRDYTASLNLVGKLVIITCMYLGRVGPISLALALGRKAKNASIRYAEGNIIVG